MKNFLLVILLFFASNIYAVNLDELTRNDYEYVRETIEIAENGHWHTAEKRAKNFRDKSFVNLLYWMKFQKEETPKDFKDMISFIKLNPSWPGSYAIKLRIEENISATDTDIDIVEWFRKHPPKTARGKIIFAEALLTKNPFQNQDEFTNLIENAWVNNDFDRNLEIYFLKNYKTYLSDYLHNKRIENLLWRGELNQATRIIDYTSASKKEDYVKRVNLMKSKKLDEVKNDYTKENDLGVIYEIVKILSKKEITVKASNLLLALPSTVKYNDRFWQLKKIQIRDAIKSKNYQLAYELAKSHNSNKAQDSSDGEWLAGWIALEFLKLPQTAIGHFEKFNNIVSYPISVSRGAYWLAKSYEATNDKINATTWYNKALKYPETFYGQLAAHKLKTKPDIINSRSFEIDDFDHAEVNKNELVKLALYLNYSDQTSYAKKFITTAVAQAKTKGQITLITELGTMLDQPNLSVYASKEALRQKVYLKSASHPILRKFDVSVMDKTILLGLIRQESEFDHKAISSAGAMGMMQLMPATAKKTAQNSKIKFHKSKLLEREYNLKIGSLHFKELLNELDDSYILSIASYNAGTRNVKKWIEVNGDPRNLNNIDEIVNWIELIPFAETRNYVQRVLENAQIYRAILPDNQFSKLTLESDLKRRSSLKLATSEN